MRGPDHGRSTSGIYYFGWLKKGQVRAAKSEAKRLLDVARAQIQAGVREAILREASEIDDRGELVERFNHGDREHPNRISVLEEERYQLEARVETLSSAQDSTLSDLAVSRDVAAISEGCLRVACAAMLDAKRPVVAGPIVFWNDGVVYPIVEIGGVRLPENSPPAMLLEALQQAGYSVVMVSEQTIIGGWLSGPRYRRGSDEIGGWLNAWSRTESRTRVFKVSPPEAHSTVVQIHNHYAGQS